jgi:glycerophosphoryl diester phosphodiesterase
MKIIAHRGHSALAPENTLAAFRLAAESDRCFAIECDVHSTKDGVFAVIHDDNLKRMTGSKVIVADEPYDVIKTYPITGGKGSHQYDGECVPRLEDFLEICMLSEKTAVIEIKRVHAFEDLKALLDLIESYQTLKSMIISFDITLLKVLRAFTDMPLQLLKYKLNEDIIYDARVNRLDLSLHDKIVDEPLVKRLHKEGFGIGVFTVDDPDQKEYFSNLGIDYLTTNTL